MKEPITKDEILSFLKDLGIDASLGEKKSETHFVRDIHFSIYGIDYEIVWFVNESTLRIGTGLRLAQIPFKHMYYDTTYPLVDGNKSIAFSYTHTDKHSFTDREYPYEVFRIPLEI